MSGQKTAGIILAAGRGSRMGTLTAAKPKCLLELDGRPLLHWQLAAMRKAGIERILVVRGYAAHCLNGDFETVENPNWENTNMLSSLLCASNFVSEFFAAGGERLLISYSDIVWRSEHAAKLLSSDRHISIAYDVLWEKLWRLRFEDPLSDAETFIQEKGLLKEIGNKTDNIHNIQGQYMGLLLFDRLGWQKLLDVTEELEINVDRTDMTTFLRHLLSHNIPVTAIPVEGGWCEADSANDIQKYEEALVKGSWSHDWRE